MGAISKPSWVKNGEKGHNIPHYSNLERVGEAGYTNNPFKERQTVFDMPISKTERDRLQQYRVEKGVVDPEPVYDQSFKVFDGLAKSGRYERLHDGTNKVGPWLSKIANTDGNAVPSKSNVLSSGSIPDGTPLRLSVSAANRFGSGGSEQYELRVDLTTLGKIFEEWT